MALLLMVAGVTYLLLGDIADAVVTLSALIPITAVTLVLEARAERALERLKQLTSPMARVFRDGALVEIPSTQISRGDVVAIREGDVIPADGLLMEGDRVMIDESALTGESLPVAKSADIDDEKQVFAGTTVVSGSGTAEITVTGAGTRYGRIGTLLNQVQPPPTPLQRLVHQLVWWLAAIAAVFCAAVVGAELLRGSGWGVAIIGGVSLAIAAVPEEFPMVYTLYPTLGAWRLSHRKSLIRRLPSVETLGATSVICTDKTGTLTLGLVEVASVVADDAPNGSISSAPSLTRSVL